MLSMFTVEEGRRGRSLRSSRLRPRPVPILRIAPEEPVVLSLYGSNHERGHEVVQLLTRHWIITDATGHIEEVRGPGVVAKQPILRPGESFEYTSGCPLTTPFGVMEGIYQMMTRRAASRSTPRFAPFTLSEPYMITDINSPSSPRQTSSRSRTSASRL